MSNKEIQIAVISDTHINHLDELPTEMIEVLKKVDLIIHLGDFVRPELLYYLKSLNNFYGIAGNHDPDRIKSILPSSDTIEVNGKRLGLIHGYWFPFFCQHRYKSSFKKDKVDAIIYGHTHVIRNEIVDNILFFNPGSATARWPAPWKTYGILNVGESITGQIVCFAEKLETGISMYADAFVSRESIIKLVCSSPRYPDYYNQLSPTKESN